MRRLRGRPGVGAAPGPRRRAVRLLRRARAGRRASARPRARCSPPRLPSLPLAPAHRAEHRGVAGDRPRRRAARAGRARASSCSRSRARSGVLRLALDPRGALEVAARGAGGRRAHARSPSASAPSSRRAGSALAVFSSEGCQMCRALAPAVAAFGRDPRVALRDVRRGPRRRRVDGRRRPRQPVRRRARRRRHGARQGHVQHRRASSSRCWRPPSAAAGSARA